MYWGNTPTSIIKMAFIKTTRFVQESDVTSLSLASLMGVGALYITRHIASRQAQMYFKT